MARFYGGCLSIEYTCAVDAELVIITLQLSMSICNNGEEIVGVSVRLNQAIRQRFPKLHHA